MITGEKWTEYDLLEKLTVVAANSDQISDTVNLIATKLDGLIDNGLARSEFDESTARINSELRFAQAQQWQSRIKAKALLLELKFVMQRLATVQSKISDLRSDISVELKNPTAANYEAAASELLSIEKMCNPKALEGFFPENSGLSERNIITASGLFDAEYYRTIYTDVASTGIEPLHHYMKYGASEGRRPSVIFNSAAYIEANSDVKELGINPITHFVLYGVLENRSDGVDVQKLNHCSPL